VGGGTYPNCETGLVHPVSKAHKIGGHISKMQGWTKQATTSSYSPPILGMASL
jgi:hypothetical protein